LRVTAGYCSHVSPHVLCRFFSFLLSSVGLDIIPLAVFRALPDIALFLVTFAVIFFGFAMGFYVIYSTDVLSFSSLR
jgi:hypothetical protein